MRTMHLSFSYSFVRLLIKSRTHDTNERLDQDMRIRRQKTWIIGSQASKILTLAWKLELITRPEGRNNRTFQDVFIFSKIVTIRSRIELITGLVCQDDRGLDSRVISSIDSLISLNKLQYGRWRQPCTAWHPP